MHQGQRITSLPVLRLAELVACAFPVKKVYENPISFSVHTILKLYQVKTPFSVYACEHDKKHHLLGWNLIFRVKFLSVFVPLNSYDNKMKMGNSAFQTQQHKRNI